MNILTGCLVLLLIFALLVYAWPLLLVLAVIAIIYQIYAALYFKSEKFNTIKEKIQTHIHDCNDLIEAALNDFSAAEDGKVALKAERTAILESISSDIPWAIKKFSQKKLEKNLGFEEVDFSTLYFPKYEFKYTSAGGNTGTTYDVVMDIDNLNRFVIYLSEKIKFSKTVAGQRALMTSKLRQHIKERDHFTCKYCGASTEAEPHLLLEIDHIVPVSKGGLTTEENLQTLCWRCNRSKSNKTTNVQVST